MRYYCALVVLLFTVTLAALELPYSHTPVYTDANKVPDFVSLQDPMDQPAPLDTDVWLWYDEQALYVEFRAQMDSTAKPGNFTSRDEAPDADFLRVQLITCPNDKFAYMYYAFPLGNLRDGVRTGLNDISYDWDSRYTYTSELTDTLWTVRMCIPFGDLRIMGQPHYRWTMNFMREIADPDPSLSYGWPQIDNKHNWGAYIDRLVPVTVEHKVQRAHNYRIEPYFNRTYDLLTHTSTFDPDHVGGTVDYRPAGSLSIKAAFNPDFSEVPPDNETDTSNLQYAESLAENRFFFIEDLDAFNIEDNYLYTRSIAQPQYAVKLTGNTRYLTYAFLNALDKRVVEDGTVTNYDDLYTVAGIRPHTQNLAFQINAMNRWNQDEKRVASTLYLKPSSELGTHHTLYGLAILTDDQRPDTLGHTVRRQGYRLAIDETMKFGDYSGGFNIRTVSTDFAPAIASASMSEDNGFHGANIWLDYSHYAYTGPISNRTASFSSYDLDNYAKGRDPETGFNGNASFSMRNGLSLNTYGGAWQEAYKGRMHHTHSCTLGGGYYHFDWFGIGLAGTWSRSLQYSLNDTFYQYKINPYINGSLAPYFSYSLGVSRTIWKDLPDSCSVDNDYYIGNFDLTLNFSARVKLTGGLRYNTYEYDYYYEGERVWWLDQHLGSFATLRYDYSDTWQFLVGYNGVTEEWNDDFEDQSKTAWFKVNATL